MKTKDTIQNMSSIVESITDIAKCSDYETALYLHIQFKELKKELLQSLTEENQ